MEVHRTDEALPWTPTTQREEQQRQREVGGRFNGVGGRSRNKGATVRFREWVEDPTSEVGRDGTRTRDISGDLHIKVENHSAPVVRRPDLKEVSCTYVEGVGGTRRRLRVERCRFGYRFGKSWSLRPITRWGPSTVKGRSGGNDSEPVQGIRWDLWKEHPSDSCRRLP